MNSIYFHFELSFRNMYFRKFPFNQFTFKRIVFFIKDLNCSARSTKNNQREKMHIYR